MPRRDPAAANRAAREWAAADPGASVDVCCSPPALEALRAAARALPRTDRGGRRPDEQRARDRMAHALAGVRVAVRAVRAGAVGVRIEVRTPGGAVKRAAPVTVYRPDPAAGAGALLDASGLPAALAGIVAATDGTSALAVVHALLPADVRPETRRDRRVLPVIRPVERDAVLPSLVGRYDADAPTLPLFAAPVRALRVPLLDLVDAAGVPVMAKGRGVPLAQRLHVGLLLAVRPGDRRLPSVRLEMRLGDLVEALYPTGTFRSVRHWETLRDTMTDAGSYGVRDGRGVWFPLALRRAPRAPDPDGLVVFDVAFPPSSSTGPTVDLPALNRLSMGPAPPWRATIAAHSIIWRPGVTRLPVPGRRGRWGWAQDPAAYPVVTREDRRRLAFGAHDAKHRTRTSIDDAWRRIPGLAIETERAVDPRTGAVGWRFVPRTDGEDGGA